VHFGRWLLYSVSNMVHTVSVVYSTSYSVGTGVQAQGSTDLGGNLTTHLQLMTWLIMSRNIPLILSYASAVSRRKILLF
jgi:hypothetical protein